MLVLKKEDIEVTVVSTEEGGVEMTLTPITESGADALNTALACSGSSDVDNYIEHLIMSTAEDVNDKFPDSTDDTTTAHIDIDKIRDFSHTAIVNRVNETLSQIKTH